MKADFAVFLNPPDTISLALCLAAELPAPLRAENPFPASPAPPSVIAVTAPLIAPPPKSRRPCSSEYFLLVPIVSVALIKTVVAPPTAAPRAIEAPPVNGAAITQAATTIPTTIPEPISFAAACVSS